jgi:SAM-dependent methyltransferase
VTAAGPAAPVAGRPADGGLRPGQAGRRPKRIDSRRLRPWRQDYLVYRYLWPDIERAVARARSEVEVEQPLVLDVGCGNRPYADLFEGCRYLGVDRSTEDAHTDAVTDATRLGFRDACFDIVFCTQVVEHVPTPASVVGETYRVLKPGGFLVLTGPFWWPLHEEPYDFQRFSRYGFAHLLEAAGFDDFEIVPDGGDWAQLFLNIALRLGGKPLAPVRLLTNALGATLDRLAPSFRCPANYTVIARKGGAGWLAGPGTSASG